MKRCHECGRNYNDDSMSFCLDDGAELVFRPASTDEPATAILSEPGAVATGFPRSGLSNEAPATAILSEPGAVATGLPRSEDRARPRIYTTDQTAIFPLGAEAEPHKDLGDSSERQSLPAHRAAKPLGIIGIAVVLLVGGFFGYRYYTSNTKQIESIAVMPFVNESGNADVEYLSDGMTETLIGSLSQIPNLSVKSRSAVFFYKGKEATHRKRSAKN